MKSVGEVMAIGRTFEEALQKALRMLDIGVEGVIANDSMPRRPQDRGLPNPLTGASSPWLAALEQAMRRPRHELTHIDPWFLAQIERIVELGAALAPVRRGLCPGSAAGGQAGGLLRPSDRAHCSDERGRGPGDAAGLRPAPRQADRHAGGRVPRAHQLSLPHLQRQRERRPAAGRPVLVLGSGAYRIGSSVEFDWCCVNTVKTLR